MKTSIATVSISGSLEDKLLAIARAGYDGVEIFEDDLTRFHGTARDVKAMTDDLGLEILALQPFRDFEAMPEPFRSQNFYRAQKKFELMHELGTKRLLICSNVSPHSINDKARAAADLAELGDLAKKEGFSVGYEALAWGRHVADYYDAWDIVKQADHSNIGIILDSFHMFARGNTLDVLRDEIPIDKIALVQVADAPKLDMEVLYFSRHFRCFPGQGSLPVVEFIQCLRDKGFDDYLSHEIFNDEFRASSNYETAVDGLRSLKWLEDQTEPQSPCPASVDDIEFVEFAVADESGDSLVEFLSAMGFEETHQHKSKNVSLMRQGDVNLVLNKEPQSQAHEHFNSHGVSVCAMAMTTPNIGQVLKRAKHFNSAQFENQAGPGELNIPAIRGIGDSLLYFVDQNGPRFYDIDFCANAEANTDASQSNKLGLGRIDHIGQTVAPTDILAASFFYKSLFGFEVEENRDLHDLYGLVVSRTAVSPSGKIRIPINMSHASGASTNRFIHKTHGSGVHQLALSCEDIFVAAAAVPQELKLPIPENYYRDLDARLGLDSELLEKLKAHNIMYDRDDKGEFFHLYTKEVSGVFFELLQRVGDYDRYGEANAHIRMAMQARAES